ncbi:hypothetical protein [Streptomyces sp. NPDC127084]|uniref:hypothetical protein n=1 Tax=Streptomyces sp. NPDC127084 TaxID=3347133 RepID=UPI0036678561
MRWPGAAVFGVPLLCVLLIDVGVRSVPDPVDGGGVVAGVPVDGDGDAALGGAGWAGLGFGFGFGVVAPGVEFPGALRGGVRSPGGVPGVLRGVVASPGVVFPGMRWAGIRGSGVPVVRPSADGVGELRGVVGVVGLGVDAGPVAPGDGVTGGGAPVDGFLAAPGLVVVPPGPVAAEWPTGVLPAWCVPAAPGVLDGVVGDEGVVGPPSARLPVPAADGSVEVGVGAALVWVEAGLPEARPSILVPIPPPSGEEDVAPDGACADAEVGCGLGDEMPETGEPEWAGPGVLAAAGGVPPVARSSKSESVGPDCDGVCLGV